MLQAVHSTFYAINFTDRLKDSLEYTVPVIYAKYDCAQKEPAGIKPTDRADQKILVSQ
jgi:hypothetical protein